MAVAQVHKRLYTSDDVQSVSVDQYLTALVDDLVENRCVRDVAPSVSPPNRSISIPTARWRSA